MGKLRETKWGAEREYSPPYCIYLVDYANEVAATCSRKCDRLFREAENQDGFTRPFGFSRSLMILDLKNIPRPRKRTA